MDVVSLACDPNTLKTEVELRVQCQPGIQVRTLSVKKEKKYELLIKDLDVVRIRVVEKLPWESRECDERTRDPSIYMVVRESHQDRESTWRSTTKKY
jgi:hypothetical protein